MSWTIKKFINTFLTWTPRWVCRWDPLSDQTGLHWLDHLLLLNKYFLRCRCWFQIMLPRSQALRASLRLGNISASAPDRGSLNCLDPGPYHSYKDASVWERADDPHQTGPYLIPLGDSQKRLSSHGGILRLEDPYPFRMNCFRVKHLAEWEHYIWIIACTIVNQ